ncbi:hypothetical protein IE81DRAFT_209166 [Ceraceosorus guamensis]|uniref:Protein-S-isoprenylcysteine O-methyltransferase n=1 Tax=Ceraceosorus guamensis TaxID=1522189 RepID=A0A316W8Z2_9BASI|nr:hypothetical protein IE81DRAFT_209166 [Ceraceosorus guamensis]PWN45241.1 hypothetical protein IE81DRAFT_209166 [Ceraceosorus guamensis]
MSTSLALQAFTASLAGIAIYVSNNDPSGSIEKPAASWASGEEQQEDRILKPKDSQSIIRKVEYFLYMKGSAISGGAQGLFLLKLFFDSRNVQPIDVVHARPSSAYLTAVTPLYISTIFAGAIRYWCYRALKEFFTFRLQVKDEQNLVKTGPYKYLAHPSYFGLFFAYIGMTTVLLGPLNVLVYLLDDKPLFESATYALPSWMVDVVGGVKSISLNPRAIARAVLCLEAIQTLRTGLWVVPTRIADEESMMRKHFGQEYDNYLAKRWRVFPFVW